MGIGFTIWIEFHLLKSMIDHDHAMYTVLNKFSSVR